MPDAIGDIRVRSAPGPYAIAQASTRDPDLVLALVRGINHPEDVIRQNSTLALLNLAENQPESLYPHWNQFEPLLQSPGRADRAFGLQIIAALSAVDDQYRFEKIFHKYFGLLDDPDVTIACYAAWCAGIIARHSPHLEPQITRRLLNIDRTQHSALDKETIKAEIIKSFRRYYLQSSCPDMLLDFAKNQFASVNSNTRILANRFVEEFNPV